MVEHALMTEHRINFQDTKILHSATTYFRSYSYRTTIRMLLSRDTGLKFSKALEPALRKIITDRDEEGRPRTRGGRTGTWTRRPTRQEQTPIVE